MAKHTDFEELKKFFKDFKDARSDFESFLEKFLLEMAQRALGSGGNIKENTPVDTGALRMMWQIEDVHISGNNLQVTIWNGMDYASFVEFGHRNWITNNWVDGRFMMTIGIDIIQRQMPARFEKAFKEYLISKGAV